MRRDKPPKLPPREKLYSHHDLHMMKVSTKIIGIKLVTHINFFSFSFQPDYDKIDDKLRIKLFGRGKTDKSKNPRQYG